MLFILAQIFLGYISNLGDKNLIFTLNFKRSYVGMMKMVTMNSVHHSYAFHTSEIVKTEIKVDYFPDISSNHIFCFFFLPFTFAYKRDPLILLLISRKNFITVNC